VPVHSDCVRAVRDAAALCEQLGHAVEEASPPLDGRLLETAYITVASSGFLWAVEDWARRTGRTPREQDFETATWAYLERARRRSAAEYLLAVQDLQRISRQVARFLTRYDLWLTPTIAAPPAVIGSFEQPPESPLRGLARGWAMMPFTWLCNATGGPAMSVPLFWNADGLPIGSHFIGRFGDEATLFRLAAQLEAARPWAGRLPPVHA
jgi:amidase